MENGKEVETHNLLDYKGVLSPPNKDLGDKGHAVEEEMTSFCCFYRKDYTLSIVFMVLLFGASFYCHNVLYFIQRYEIGMIDDNRKKKVKNLIFFANYLGFIRELLRND